MPFPIPFPIRALPLALAVLLLVAPVAPARAAPPAAARAAAPASGWVPPLPGSVVVRRGFDPPSVRWGAGHRGVDLASSAGAVVVAAGGGEVTYAGVLAGRGVVVVSHGTLRTTYEPVSALADVGDAVSPGTPIGVLDPGHPGAYGGEALLHWGLLRGETYLDPLTLLRRGPSRLVPVAPASPAPAAAAPPFPAPAFPAPAAAAPPFPAPLPGRGTASVTTPGAARGVTPGAGPAVPRRAPPYAASPAVGALGGTAPALAASGLAAAGLGAAALRTRRRPRRGRGPLATSRRNASQRSGDRGRARVSAVGGFA